MPVDNVGQMYFTVSVWVGRKEMKATVLAIGKCKKNSPEAMIIDEYVKRSGWDVAFKEKDNASQEEEARFCRQIFLREQKSLFWTNAARI